MELENINNSLSEQDAQIKSISVFDQVDNYPLIYALDKKLVNNDFNIIKYSPLNSGRALLDGEVDLGMIPVTAFAATKESWRIVPHISISGNGTFKSVKLFFKKGLKDIQTIAIDERAATESVLLKVLMPEKFNVTPDYITMKPNVDMMLKKADAALLIGDEALHEQEVNKSCFDLGEEWFDMTGLPMVYAFCAGRNMIVQKEDTKNIINAVNLGLHNLEDVTKEYAKNSEFGWPLYHDFLTQNVHYTFKDKEIEGLVEFYNYAFYYGLIAYIPDILFFEIETFRDPVIQIISSLVTSRKLIDI